MKQLEIEKLAFQTISKEVFENVKKNKSIVELVNLGITHNHLNSDLYRIDFKNGTEVKLYVRHEKKVAEEPKQERYITCATYERALKRTEKAVLRNMGY